MTVPPATAGQPRDGDLAARFFRALYQEFDLYTVNGIYVVVPKGTPWFAGPSLGGIARQMSGHDYPGPAGPRTGSGRSMTMDAHDRREARALRRIAGILAAQGLEVTEATSCGGLAELAITNPAQPSRGRMYVGHDGYVIWEYWTPADASSAGAEIIGTVTAMLGGQPQ